MMMIILIVLVMAHVVVGTSHDMIARMKRDTSCFHQLFCFLWLFYPEPQPLG